MNTTEDIQKEIVDEFEGFTDWIEKYNYIIELGKSLSPFKDEYRTKEYLIEGCQSQVWLSAEYVDGKVFFYADSDALITKGIISLLIRIFSGHTPQEILNTELWFADKIGLTSHLSLTRSNGLASMIKQIKMYALAFKTKYNK